MRPDRIETAAGGVVYRRRNGNVEVFFIKDSFGRWTFPKGHQELGETLAETAIREIREETGLTGLRYLAPLGKKVLRFRREVGMIHKSVHYFLFEAPPDAKEHFSSRAEVGEDRELIQEGKWVSMRQAFSVSSYKNSDHLLANAFRLIGSESSRPPQQPALAGQQQQTRQENRPRHRRRRWKPNGPPGQGPRAPKLGTPPNAPRITF